MSKQWGQVLSSSLSSVDTHAFPSPVLWDTALGTLQSPPHSHVHTHTAHRGKQVQAAAGSAEAPEEAGIRGTGGLGHTACGLPGGRGDEARGHPGFPLEPQGPPCLSTGVLVTSPGAPSPFLGSCRSTACAQKAQPLVTPPTPFPAQSHRKNAILIPQH